MLLSEAVALVHIFAGDVARNVDRGFIDLLLNTGALEFVKATSIFRVRAQVKIVNGVGQLNAIPDSINLAGRILRVEDANNGNKALKQTNENILDVLPGPQWRQNAQGPLKEWYRGTPNEGQQDGYGTIGTYPCVANGLINLFYVGTPRKLVDDSSPSDIPEHFQIALVWYAVQMLLSAKGDQAMATQLQFATDRWTSEVERGKDEVGSWLTKMGA